MDPITLIMVAHGRAEVLRKTLAGLAACTQPTAFRGTIVAENGPPCGMEAVIAEFSQTLRIEHLRVTDRRKSVALNEALHAAESGWALFIDDDVRVSPDWIQVYADAIAESPDGHYFGGPTACDYEQAPPEWLRKYLPDSARGLQFPSGTREVRYPNCFLGFNWAARVESLLQAGGFPEQFGPGTPYGGGDESFMQRSLAELGQTGILIPQALVWHQIPADRCSPEWCLKRMYCGGQTVGLEAAWLDRQHPRPLASLRSYLRHWKNRLTGAPLLDLLRLGAHGRFWFARTRLWMQGFRAGYREANTRTLPRVATPQLQTHGADSAHV
jgi:glycosyltransferase involved in cell wall biosynthesis